MSRPGEPDGEADLGDRQVGVAQQVLRSLDTAGESGSRSDSLVRGPEAPGEMILGHSGYPGERTGVQRPGIVPDQYDHAPARRCGGRPGGTGRVAVTVMAASVMRRCCPGLAAGLMLRDHCCVQPSGGTRPHCLLTWLRGWPWNSTLERRISVGRWPYVRVPRADLMPALEGLTPS